MSALRLPVPLLPADGLRITRWRVDPALAHVALTPYRRRPVDTDELRRRLAELRERGWQGVVTAALAPADQQAFLDTGFRVVERLHLLRHRLRDLPALASAPAAEGEGPVALAPGLRTVGAPPPGRPAGDCRAPGAPRRRPAGRPRRARRRDHPAVLAIDRAAFVPFWQLDEITLSEALHATRTVRFRVVDHDARVAGYAVCGRSAARGYIQRLAVDPRHHGRGLGTALLLDGLRWLARWRAQDVLVNTQEGNDRSLRLYLRTGFELEPGGLAVLRLDF